MSTLRIALAQLNTVVGDLAANRDRVAGAILRAKCWRADLVAVPELALTGYPPEDLLLKPRFVEDNLRMLERLRPMARGLAAVVGCVERGRRGELYNAAAVLADGRRAASYHKQCLPNYGVFDEKRYFAPGSGPAVLDVGGVRVGLTICEDLWEESPVRVLAKRGCRLVVNLSASPYHADKLRQRQALFARRARTCRVAIAYCNLVGGQDELVFDGGSLVLDARGRLVACGWQFREDLVIADLELPASAGKARRGARAVPIPWTPMRRPPAMPTRRAALSPLEERYAALVLGLRDYVRKNGFETAVLGLSGGIDSALTCCLAVDALGKAHVVGVVMPSRFSSPDTQRDAAALAQRLGIRCEDVSIEPCFTAYLDTVKRLFGRRPADVTEQNLQARIRGTLLMALSNKFGWLVLTTGNKSELACGYCTIYGDMAGGFAVIKDVPKTLVYALSRWRNRLGAPIPERVFTRAPTAELAPNQKDTDSLPPYGVLDPILKAYVEEDQSVPGILRTTRFKPETVRRVVRMVDRAEYKRRQGPPGIKITPKAFGKDRRMPITNRYQNS